MITTKMIQEVLETLTSEQLKTLSQCRMTPEHLKLLESIDDKMIEKYMTENN